MSSPPSGQIPAGSASPAVAGVIARTDTEFGFWHSPSNKEIFGIAGTAVPVEFALDDATTLANRLNEANIATVVRRNGVRLWGNRVPSADSLWAVLPVRRTADVIEDSIEAAQFRAMDKPFSAQPLKDIEGSVLAYLRQLQAQGAILGGSVWIDPDLNTAQTLQAGQLYLNYDFEPPVPLERLTLRAYRNGDYYTSLIASVATATT